MTQGVLRTNARINGFDKEVRRFYRCQSYITARRKGEIFGLLGPNGAGKSTTVSMISTVLPPTGGTICIDGTSLQERPAAIKK